MRLGEDKLETLRRWAQGLRQASGEEQAAAGRAIQMLIEEIDRLHVELRHAREQRGPASPLSSEEGAEDADEPFAPALDERLQQALGRDSDSSPEPRPEPGVATSAKSWIEGLRRQK